MRWGVRQPQLPLSIKKSGNWRCRTPYLRSLALRHWAVFLPHLPPVLLAILQLRTQARPLRVRQNTAHVDEHHQLALEQPSARFVDACGDLLDVLAIELRLFELAAQRDLLLLDCAAKINE